VRHKRKRAPALSQTTICSTGARLAAHRCDEASFKLFKSFNRSAPFKTLQEPARINFDSVGIRDSAGTACIEARMTVPSKRRHCGCHRCSDKCAARKASAIDSILKWLPIFTIERARTLLRGVRSELPSAAMYGPDRRMTLRKSRISHTTTDRNSGYLRPEKN
jgi:hypothetical protein